MIIRFQRSGRNTSGNIVARIAAKAIPAHEGSSRSRPFVVRRLAYAFQNGSLSVPGIASLTWRWIRRMRLIFGAVQKFAFAFQDAIDTLRSGTDQTASALSRLDFGIKA
jgi:hypothetical protein